MKKMSSEKALENSLKMNLIFKTEILSYDLLCLIINKTLSLLEYTVIQCVHYLSEMPFRKVFRGDSIFLDLLEKHQTDKINRKFVYVLDYHNRRSR